MSAKFLKYYAVIFLLLMIVGSVILYNLIPVSADYNMKGSDEAFWEAPDINRLPATDEAGLIRYGKQLIESTSVFLGPKGTVATISNGMECQNCHIKAGTQLYGNALGAVASTYPKYRDRSGRIESIEFRINECMERSMNGKEIDSSAKEMRAMVAYLKWLGKDVPKGVKPAGTGIPEIAFLDRAADPGKGSIVYISKCQSCHGEKGEGTLKIDSTGYVYPPLWGPHSYNISAGIYRLSRFAAFVKYNMPYSKAYNDPPLTDEEAWDVAAFVNSQQRPEKFFSYDWKDIRTKPVDYPFGPYADSFNSIAHKYGPFKVMKLPQTANKNSKK
jgi:thiosulfate dehydrogenase